MDKAQRREELLRAARDVFASKGYHDAKIDDIVAAAGVAKGTFYLYFPDKRSVLEELVDGLFGRMGGAILKVDPGSDVTSQVKHNIRAVLAVLLDDPGMTQVLLSYAAGLDPAFLEKIRSFYGGAKVLLERALAEGQELGIVAPGDTEMFATFTIGALKEMLSDLPRSGRVRTREALVEEIFGFLEKGYLRSPPAR
ncbi:MAG: TetR/AcrR family transcriptional regulator, partial [Deltaproteobacteria bacterium]|nr:TetR/AcrR family transcriptional regulator [Deltaproteobacteria bacterium]